ncbi:MFS transporter [Streptomyces sp. GD-15H]|uniref:MFS transporter n=1 Tax=Streptomyces sp. GD-15H TaxID=3129112 RepID=UPI0032494D00
MDELFRPLSFIRGPAMKNRFALAPMTNKQSADDGTASIGDALTTSVATPALTDKRKRRKVARAGAVGNFIEFFDFTLYGFFAVTIAALFFPQESPTAALLSTFALFGVAFFIRPVGAIVFGHIGDRIGRKRALVVAVILMSGSTTAIGALPTYETVGILAPVMLLLCRLTQGFSAGGELTGAMVLVVEHSPVKERGRNASWVIASIVSGVAGASLVALLVSFSMSSDQLLDWGWRIPFLIAAPLGLAGLILRLNLEESDAYKSAVQEMDGPENARTPLAQAFKTVKQEMLTLFGWVAVQSFAGDILVGFMLTYLVTRVGYAMAEALLIIVIGHVIAIAFIPVLGRWADRVSRKCFAAALAGALAIWTLPAFLLLSRGMVAAVVAIAVYATINYSMMTVQAFAVVELFPVDVRYTASAFPFQLAYALFGGSAPFVATWLVSNVSDLTPAYAIVVLALPALWLAWSAIPNAREMAVVSFLDTEPTDD